MLKGLFSSEYVIFFKKYAAYALSDFTLLICRCRKNAESSTCWKQNEIVVSRNESVCAIAGNALDPDGKAGKALFAKLGQHFPIQYSTDVEKEKGNFALSLREKFWKCRGNFLFFNFLRWENQIQSSRFFPIVKKLFS
jgi:hypothetical protein